MVQFKTLFVCLDTRVPRHSVEGIGSSVHVYVHMWYVTCHTQRRPGHSSWSQIVISFTSSVYMYTMHDLQTDWLTAELQSDIYLNIYKWWPNFLVTQPTNTMTIHYNPPSLVYNPPSLVYNPPSLVYNPPSLVKALHYSNQWHDSVQYNDLVVVSPELTSSTLA